MLALKAIAALLDYPTEETVAALDEIAACVAAEPAIPGPVRERIEALVRQLGGSDLLSLQEDYVALFDRTRRLSLHLYEHVHGESRDRGQAMVNLATVYRLHGFELAAPEMPDYLPLFCEFLSQIPEPAARGYLRDAAAVIEALRVRLAESGSPFAALMEALVTIAGTADAAEVAAILENEPAEPASPDEEWEEKPVTFGAGAALAGCRYAQAPLSRNEAAAVAPSLEG